MLLGRVVGNVVATQKHEKFHSKALLLVQPISLDGEDEGEPLLAVDTVGAGAGETVIVVLEGRSTSQAMGRVNSPANAAITGIVDHIEWEQ
jgi:ethanolamine utilization protein EutN